VQFCKYCDRELIFGDEILVGDCDWCWLDRKRKQGEPLLDAQIDAIEWRNAGHFRGKKPSHPVEVY
jgi:hypothetical protein